MNIGINPEWMKWFEQQKLPAISTLFTPIQDRISWVSSSSSSSFSFNINILFKHWIREHFSVFLISIIRKELSFLSFARREKTSILNEKKDVQCAASSCAYVHILPFFFRGRTNKLIHFFFIFLRSVHSPDRQRRRRFVLLSRRSDSGSLWVEFFAAPSPSLIREKVCATI